MDNNQFYLNIWKFVVLFLCVAVVTGGGCTMNRVYQTRLLIENAKVSPIDAKCALEADVLSTAACIIRAQK